MDKKQVDERLAALWARSSSYVAALLPLFEPSSEMYGKLSTGDDADLRWVADLLCSHLHISPHFCGVQYDWSIGLDPRTAGQISGSSGHYEVVIPFSAVGNGYRVGTILAHEMSHAFLFWNGVHVADQLLVPEQMTDLTAVVTGLGKLLLNGLVTHGDDPAGSEHTLGYVPPSLVAYAYVKTASTRHYDDQASLVSNLVPDAAELVLNELSSFKRQQ